MIAAPKMLGEKLSRVFSSAGYRIAAVCSSGNEARRIAFDRSPDLLVTTAKLPDTLALDLVESLYIVKSTIVLVNESEKESLHALNERLIYLTFPIKRLALLQMADILTQGGTGPMPAPRSKPENMRSEEDQRMIVQAKEHLIRWYDLTEAQAHRRLQIWSMNSGKRMSEVARIILEET